MNDFVSPAAFEATPHGMVQQHSLACSARARVLPVGRVQQLWELPAALAACGLHFAQAIIWIKEHHGVDAGLHGGITNGVSTAGMRAAISFGPNNATDVWSVKKVNPQEHGHLTEKPVELAARAIQYSSRAKGVLDLFEAAARR